LFYAPVCYSVVLFSSVNTEALFTPCDIETLPKLTWFVLQLAQDVLGDDELRPKAKGIFADLGQG
jgi:hypothetical protein